MKEATISRDTKPIKHLFEGRSVKNKFRGQFYKYLGSRDGTSNFWGQFHIWVRMLTNVVLLSTIFLNENKIKIPLLIKNRNMIMISINYINSKEKSVIKT